MFVAGINYRKNAAMRLCVVHNEYGKFSGEEAVVQGQISLLEKKGHQVCRFVRSSAELETMPFGHIRAFFSGIYNPFSKRAFRRFLATEKPDLVHFHNLYPLISPAVLDVCAEIGMPTVMTVHNYRLVCPNGLFMSSGEVCERCAKGGEFWCLLRNCEGSYLKSLGYSIRNIMARLRGSFSKNISIFMVLNSFQKLRLEDAGFGADKIFVVPNMCNDLKEYSPPLNVGRYVAYAGRLSAEKGIASIVDASHLCSSIPFKVAGSGPFDLSSITDTSNFEMLGFLEKDRLDGFYKDSRFLVFPSIWYETFGLTIVEAMLHGKPVIASRIGGVPEIVEDGVTGLLFEPGNAEDLAEKIRYLWARPDLCRKMGEAGREKALREYSPEMYYDRLMKVYDKAIELCRN